MKHDTGTLPKYTIACLVGMPAHIEKRAERKIKRIVATMQSDVLHVWRQTYAVKEDVASHIVKELIEEELGRRDRDATGGEPT